MDGILNHVITLENGEKVINTCPHSFTFDDGTEVPPCGITLNCDFMSREIDLYDNADGDIVVTTITNAKVPEKNGLAFLNEIKRESVISGRIWVLGSANAAEAYGFPVVATVPTVGTTLLMGMARKEGRRLTSEEMAMRRVRSDQFSLPNHK
jgi:hypothetical protein